MIFLFMVSPGGYRKLIGNRVANPEFPLRIVSKPRVSPQRTCV
jgi:hypothetical protein